MTANIIRTESGYMAKIEKHLHHPVSEVWAYLTENDKLRQWFAELRIDELRTGGTLSFDMGDGSFEVMNITELHVPSVLEYTWDKDLVRFELYEEEGGCRLVFMEQMKELTDHTPRDLAGWHVCLDVIEALLEGKLIDYRKALWEPLYEQYLEVLARVQSRTD